MRKIVSNEILGLITVAGFCVVLQPSWTDLVIWEQYLVFFLHLPAAVIDVTVTFKNRAGFGSGYF